ncbi:MAG: hypothetical protein ABIK23_02240 [candidate division WOR-3 bacterium]
MPLYQVLFYDGGQILPCYQLIDYIEGESPASAFKANLDKITEKTRRNLQLGGDFPDYKIHESLCILDPETLFDPKRHRIMA